MHNNKGGGRVVRRCWVSFQCRGDLLICLDIFTLIYPFFPLSPSLWGGGWSGGAIVLGKLPVPGASYNLDYSRARLTVGAGGGCLDILTLVYPFSPLWGWSGGAMVLGKLSVPGRPTIWITVGQGPTALAVGAGRGCLDICTLIYPFSSLSPSLWETTRYRLKYCLGWLVGCFRFNGPLRQYFSLYRAVSQREGERGKKG